MLCLHSKRSRDSGFTLTELMITVVIVGILAAVASPMMTRDKQQDDGRAFSGSVARDFQRARSQAVSERLPVHAYIFRDRIEYRIARDGAAAGDPPVMPTLADPVLRVLQAKTGVTVLDVTTVATPPAGQVLTTAVPVEIQFTTVGGVRVMGQALWSPAFVWVRNNSLPMGHRYRDSRIDVAALTGFVRLRERL